MVVDLSGPRSEEKFLNNIFSVFRQRLYSMEYQCRGEAETMRSGSGHWGADVNGRSPQLALVLKFYYAEKGRILLGAGHVARTRVTPVQKVLFEILMRIIHLIDVRIIKQLWEDGMV
jgi:hypothetical protein